MYFYKYTVLLKYLKIQLDTILKIILVELVIVKCRTLKLVARMLKLFVLLHIRDHLALKIIFK